MTREKHPQHASHRDGFLGQTRAALKKKKPYKIMLEAVTQQKKKLKTIATSSDDAPSGFGFIAAGKPTFTNWCREQCRQRNLEVHVVSAQQKNKIHADPDKLSYHTHRIGLHFPLHIIQEACSIFDYTYDEANGLRKIKTANRTNWIAEHFENYSSRQLHSQPTTEGETKDQVRGAIREMFPKIPEVDKLSIVKHAFEEGTNRVGNASNLSLPRKVQLAVLAHIRHNYTDYDKLLKTLGWLEARAQVEHVSLAKLKEWRDEAGEQSNELEETFREIIVIDDDEEVSSDDGSPFTPDERDQSMEIVFSRATAQDLQPERYTDYPRTDRHDMRRPYSPPPRSAMLSALSHTQSIPVMDSRLSSMSHVAHSRRDDPRMRPAAFQPGPELAPIMMDGQLYQLQPISSPRHQSRVEYDTLLQGAPRRAPEGYVQSLPRLSLFDRSPANAKKPSEQDVVLPSVEHGAADFMSPRRVAGIRQSMQSQESQPRGYVDMQPSKENAVFTALGHRDAYFEQSNTRSRPMYREDEMPPRTTAYQSGPLEYLSYQSMDARNHERGRPLPQVVDLTSSPYRPPSSDDKGLPPSYRSIPVDADGYAYVYLPSFRSHVRETRAAYHDEPARMPDNRMYARRVSPAREYIPMRLQQLRPRAEDRVRLH